MAARDLWLGRNPLIMLFVAFRQYPFDSECHHDLSTQRAQFSTINSQFQLQAEPVDIQTDPFVMKLPNNTQMDKYIAAYSGISPTMTQLQTNIANQSMSMSWGLSLLSH